MRNTRFLFVKIAVLAFSVFCFVTLVSLQLQNNHLHDTAQSLSTQIDEYEEYIGTLQATLDAPMDEEYVAEIAREKLGLRYPQEVKDYTEHSHSSD